ncbi:MAG: 3'-5' exonuclease [Sulfurovaceae bacterium]|nr:3'-5' exonuclease [Sulfurovaceae bacterium]
MFNSFKKRLMQKKLKDPKWNFLFDKNINDECVVFDTETTGLNPKKDNIVSIGAIKIRGNKILTNEAFHVFVKQDNLISKDSIKVHKIRNCDLKDAMELKDAIDMFLNFIGNRTLIGYYLEFDVAMINKYIKPMYGITLPNDKKDVSAIYYDKKKELIPQGNIDLRFDTILKNLSLPKLQGHDALNDAFMTAMMYLKLQNIDSIK